MKHAYIVIMAGGIGSRFWPASTAASPKQFLDIAGKGKSLLRITYDRFRKIVPAERIIVLTHADYAGRVLEELDGLPASNILSEPSRNNTAPSVAYAALHLQGIDPRATMLIAPSDHVIEKESAFLALVKDGLAFVRDEEAILTLGMRPSRPDTGYGYIQYNNNNDRLAGNSLIFRVKQFTEKPDLERAKRFLSSGDFVWNAGIFLFSVTTILEAFQDNSPEIYAQLTQEPDVFGTDGEADYIRRVYPDTPNISIDYAIMEKAQNIYTLPAQIGWSDLGTWGSVYDRSEKDEKEVVIQHEGPHYVRDTKRSLLRFPKDKKVVIRGLEGYIVVDTPDALLIYPMEEEQQIKADRQRVLPDKTKE
jgi:mannose-1-phosphate guanylyltransferase